MKAMGGNPIEKLLFLFLIILIGVILDIAFKWWESIKKTNNVNRILGVSTKLVLFVINPLILIGIFWNTSIENMKLALLPILGAICLILGGIFSLIAANLFKLDRAKKGSMFVSGSFTNLGALGTMFCFSSLGETSLVYVALFRLLEDFIYYTVGYPVAKAYGKSEQKKDKLSQVILRVAKNPFIIVAVIGITIGGALSFSTIDRPESYNTLIEILVPLSTLLLMIPIGYSIRLGAIKNYIKESIAQYQLLNL